ncbi:MAG TPA: hypothetical protein VFM05_09365, partial [Candidatus Saccharimonadales bacterium]|nr:hypothetical protein [Candidatus Saccharimonadales bacterium]
RRRLIFHHLPERPQVDYSIDLGNEIKIQEAGGQEKTVLPWPRKACFLREHLSISSCLCSDFLLLPAVSVALHQTAKRALCL